MHFWECVDCALWHALFSKMHLFIMQNGIISTFLHELPAKPLPVMTLPVKDNASEMHHRWMGLFKKISAACILVTMCRPVYFSCRVHHVYFSCRVRHVWFRWMRDGVLQCVLPVVKMVLKEYRNKNILQGNFCEGSVRRLIEGTWYKSTFLI